VLHRSEPELIELFKQQAYLARIPVGEDVFLQGDSVRAIPLLLSGLVRVYQIGDTGREVTLYRFRPGESCVLSANAILSDQSFPAIATVEEEAEAVMIPAESFREWMGRFESWRSFVFEMVSQRLASVMTIVDDVAFRRLDARVAGLLHERGQTENPIHVTHQEIAAELGSSREVISRLMETFVQDELVVSGRGKIEVINFPGLQARAKVT
jgi:CRP/FNR family transcriptional regulator